jgi:CRP/FNR family transcriptional regulator, nitrogen oxide reductase regulator
MGNNPREGRTDARILVLMVTLLDRPSVASALHSSTLFNALTPTEMESLACVGRLVHAQRGETIWLSGADVDFFGLVANGFVKMVKPQASGNDVTLELMGPGQVFGLLGTIDGKGCPLMAVAVTDVWYLRIPKSVFLPIYQDNGTLKDRLVRRLSVRYHDTLELLARMSSGRVDERIAAILYILSESYAERVKEGIRIQVPLTRQDLSEMAGTTVESTIRVLSRWQKAGIVSTERHYITILDEPALNAVLSKVLPDWPQSA